MKHNNIPYTVLILFLFMLPGGCSSSGDKQIEAAPLFPERHGWDLKQVSISDAETTLDFKRVDCVWVVGNDNRPSDEPKVTALADKLVTLAPQTAPAIVPDRFRDFKVGDDSFTRRVVLTFKDNSSNTLLIGTPAITKPVYIRLAGNTLVYKIDAPLLMQISLNIDSWLAPKEGQGK